MLLSSWHQQSLTQNALNRPQMIGSWTHKSRTLTNKRSNYIELSKLAKYYTKDQVQEKFPHLIKALNAMESIAS